MEGDNIIFTCSQVAGGESAAGEGARLEMPLAGGGLERSAVPAQGHGAAAGVFQGGCAVPNAFHLTMKIAYVVYVTDKHLNLQVAALYAAEAPKQRPRSIAHETGMECCKSRLLRAEVEVSVDVCVQGECWCGSMGSAA